MHFRLYVSRLNSSTYEVYDLSDYSEHIIFAIDYILFDELGYAVMYSPPGASRTLARYDLNSQSLETVDFPDRYRLVGCNNYTGVNQLRLRFIYQLGVEGRFLACTNGAPGGGPLIHVINVNTLAIEQSLDIDANFGESRSLGWTVAGGLDNKIYALVYNPESTIADLPQIDEAKQEIILIYDIASQTWDYQIKPKEEHFLEIVTALPNEQVFFGNTRLLGESLQVKASEFRQFDPEFQIIRRFIALGIFQGMTSDGYMFFSTGPDYSDISIIDVTPDIESPE